MCTAVSGDASIVVRVATWNLERCPNSRLALAAAQNRRIESVNADIWVLTETFLDRTPGDGWSGVFSPVHPSRRSGPDERFVGIWSRWPIAALAEPAPHRRGSVAALITTPAGEVLVYGCVIAYGGERNFDDGRPARQWEVHAAEIDRQAEEWRLLRDRFPRTPMIVAGDFNQARSGRPHSYGTDELRTALTDGLSAADLTSLTDVDLVADGRLHDRSHVEHICITPDLSPAGAVMAWDRSDESAQRLSDHPTLAVDLSLRAAHHS